MKKMNSLSVEEGVKVVLGDRVRGGAGGSGSRAVVRVRWISHPEGCLSPSAASASEFAVQASPPLPSCPALGGKSAPATFAALLLGGSPANLQLLESSPVVWCLKDNYFFMAGRVS